MTFYQGRAMRAEPRRPRRTRGHMLGRVLRVLAVIAVLVALAHLPWESWRKRFAVLRDVRVTGAEYLDPQAVVRYAGVRTGDDLLALDLDRIRQLLLEHARIADARVSRRGLRGLAIAIRERRPVLLVRHGVPWEMDSAGVLLPPLEQGAVADVPMLAGPDLERYGEGASIRTAEIRRGLAWVDALSGRPIQLAGRVSEIDVSSDRSTALLLMNGTRVLSPAWPPDARTLSGLRVVIANLEKQGGAASEIDIRFDSQFIVRPAEPGPIGAAQGARTS